MAMEEEEEWSSLLPELAWRIADCLLETNDIDTYVDMRAVRPGWRSAIPRPPPVLDGGPSEWVILEDPIFPPCDQQSHLFLNVSTGRFVRRRLPLHRSHAMLGVAASGGLLLVEKFPFPAGDTDSTVYVAADALLAINPFTGYRLTRPRSS